jgi:hypothetical protein
MVKAKNMDFQDQVPMMIADRTTDLRNISRKTCNLSTKVLSQPRTRNIVACRTANIYIEIRRINTFNATVTSWQPKKVTLYI